MLYSHYNVIILVFSIHYFHWMAQSSNLRCQALPHNLIGEQAKDTNDLMGGRCLYVNDIDIIDVLMSISTQVLHT